MMMICAMIADAFMDPVITAIVSATLVWRSMAER